MLGTKEQKLNNETGEALLASESEAPAVPRSKRFNQIIVLSALAILLNALLTYSVTNRPELLKVGDTIPQFNMDVMGGGKVSETDFTGKPTVYFFYADWCPCSNQSIGKIQKAQRDYSDAGLALIGIGIQSSSGKLEGFARKYAIDFPVIVKGGDDMARSMGVKTTPTTIYVDGGGVVRSIFVGKIERYDQMTEGLNSILQNRNTPVSG